MENKEVEQLLEQIKVEYALLEGKLFYQNKDVERLLEDNKNLTKRIQEQDSCIKRLQGNKKNRESYIINLEQQLQAKDKALDKICKKIAYIISMDDECMEEVCNRKICDAKCDNDCNNALIWKEWAENETN